MEVSNSLRGSVNSNTGFEDVQILRSTRRLSDSHDEEDPPEQQMADDGDTASPPSSFCGTSINADILPPRLRWVAKHSIPSLLEATLRGVSQVVIVNNPTAGLVILFGLFIDSVWMTTLVIVATMFSTWVASHFFVDTAYVKNGLAGYNAALVACALSVFLQNEEWHFGTFVAVLFGGLSSTILNMSLKSMMGSVPTWTLAFNIVTLPGLAYSLPALAATIIPIETIVQRELYSYGLINTTDLLITAVEATHEETVAESTNHVLLSPLVGVSQIFVVNNPWTGALILLAMALESRGLALAAFMGSCIGCVCGAYVGGEIGITDGLWGFNSSLVAVAVAVFFVPTWPGVAVASVGSLAAGVLFAGMATAMGNAFSTPCLTLPFCIIATICHLLLTDGDIRGCIGARVPIGPEANYAAWQAELKEKADEEKTSEAKHKTAQQEAAASVKEANEQARVFYGPSTVQPHDTSKSPVDRALRPQSQTLPGDKHHLLSSTEPQKHHGADILTAGGERPRRPGGRSVDEPDQNPLNLQHQEGNESERNSTTQLRMEVVGGSL